MKHVTGLIVGMILLVLGAQGAIRLLADHDDAGLLHWMPGGFAMWLSCHAVAVVAGVLLAGWGGKRARQGGRGERPAGGHRRRGPSSADHPADGGDDLGDGVPGGFTTTRARTPPRRSPPWTPPPAR